MFEPKPVMQFRVKREEEDDSSVPPVLRTIERLLPGPDTVEREFVLSKNFDRNLWVINGKPFDPARIDIKPRLGDTEVWTFRNNSSMPHPMHIHLVRFQLLDRGNLRLRRARQGGYTVGWTTTSTVDGHSLHGSYSFDIGTAAAANEIIRSGPIDSEGWLGLAGRFIALTGLVLWAGSAVEAPL